MEELESKEWPDSGEWQKQPSLQDVALKEELDLNVEE